MKGERRVGKGDKQRDEGSDRKRGWREGGGEVTLGQHSYCDCVSSLWVAACVDSDMLWWMYTQTHTYSIYTAKINPYTQNKYMLHSAPQLVPFVELGICPSDFGVFMSS